MEWRICFSPSFISLWSCLSQWGKTGNLSLWISPHISTTTTTAYCWCKALKVGIPTMLSLRETANPPTVQTSSWQPNWSGIRLKRLQLLPKLCNVGKGTSAGQRAGRAVQQVQRRALLVHLSRGWTRRWGGWGWGANKALRTRRQCLALFAS